MHKQRRIFKVLAFLGWSLGACWAQQAADSQFESLGITYSLQEVSAPRPNRIHVIRVDLAAGRVQPDVILANDPDGAGPAEAALTDPLSMAAGRSVLAFVNTNPWAAIAALQDKTKKGWYETQPVDIVGAAVTDGHVRSAADEHVAVWIQGGGVAIGQIPQDAAVQEAVGGFTQIVKAGTVIAETGGPIHPRTALGVNESGQILWMVVVDGRQKSFSEGMALDELAAVMRDLGCWDAANMDGGGSSVMAMSDAAGKLQVMNSPSDRAGGKVKIRPLPAILAIIPQAAVTPSEKTKAESPTTQLTAP